MNLSKKLKIFICVLLMTGCQTASRHDLEAPEINPKSKPISSQSGQLESKLPQIHVMLKHQFEDNRVNTYKFVADASEALSQRVWPVADAKQTKPSYEVRFSVVSKKLKPEEGYLCQIRWIKPVRIDQPDIVGMIKCDLIFGGRIKTPQKAKELMISAQGVQDIALEMSGRIIELLDFKQMK